MKRYLKLGILLCVFYLLPLIGSIDRILDWRILVLMTSCATVFLTQPDFNSKEVQETQNTDRHSLLVIFIGAAFAQILPVIEWAYLAPMYRTPEPSISAPVGLCLLLGGVAFRVWAIRVLGRFFTATVQIVEEQSVVSSGPYRIVRHPSYLGAYAAIVGSAILLEAYVSAFVVGILMFLVYRYRILAEEDALHAALGSAYANYCQQKARLLPCVW